MKKTTAILAILFPVVFIILVLLGFSVFGKKFFYLLGIPLGIGIPYLYAAFNFVRAPEKWIVEKNLPWYEEPMGDCCYGDIKGMIEIIPGKKYRIGKTIIIIWGPGIHFLWFPIAPFMLIKNKLSCANKSILITLGMDDGKPGDKSLVDFRDASVPVKLQIVLQVVDILRATYAIDSSTGNDYEKAAIMRTESTFRGLLATLNLGDAMVNASIKSQAAKQTFIDVNSAISEWGAQLTNPGGEITIFDFELPPEILKSWQMPMEAERARQAQLTKAKGDMASKILEAQGKKKARILDAEGEAKAIKSILLAEGVGLAEKVNFLADAMKISVPQVIDFLLKQGMITSAEKATLIATSEGGKLNYPLEFGTAFSAASNAQRKHTKSGEGGEEPPTN